MDSSITFRQENVNERLGSMRKFSLPQKASNQYALEKLDKRLTNQL